MIRPPPRSTLSLHDALPISQAQQQPKSDNSALVLDAIKREIERIGRATEALKDESDPKQKEEREKRDLVAQEEMAFWAKDRKSTRLNSSHSQISYAVFCLKK